MTKNISISKRKNNLMTHRINDTYHFFRKRVNTLLTDAAKNPLTTVCAGAGCGKTRAVYDFLQNCKTPAIWIQFGEHDNISSRFWDNSVNSLAQVNAKAADECKKLGFPDSAEKFNRFISIMFRHAANDPLAMVVDDFHLASDPTVLQFVERVINELPSNRNIILIGREMPKINITNLQIKGLVSEINEADLNFTEKEMSDYFYKQNLPVDSETLYEVNKDTRGWALAVNLIARSLEKAPAYSGFVNTMLKQNIYALMEVESWNLVSERLKTFLVQLSLVELLSVDLVDILIAGNADLLSEFRKQIAYVRFGSYSGVYQIHHLFLDFLRTKQDILTDDEKTETYKTAADWYKQNGFKIDALRYYEIIKDYDSIVTILWDLCEHTSHDLSLYTLGIFERAHVNTFVNVDFFAAMHLHTLLCLCRWQEFAEKATAYEKLLASLPENNNLRNHTLGGIYFFWSYVRFLMSTTDGIYDFDDYTKKAADCLNKSPTELTRKLVVPLGSWVSAVGRAEADAPKQFAEVTACMLDHVSSCFNSTKGSDKLCLGELKFYQNDIRSAESLFEEALNCAREYKQFEIMQRALFYIIRIAIIQGDQAKADQSLSDMKSLLEEENYSRRFTAYEIVFGWYHCFLRQIEKVPDWLKNKFAPYGHAYFIENFGNQIKARYHYIKRNYPPLLNYIKDMKERESILYGRVEMLAMEACVHYQMKNKPSAWIAFKEAYEAANPNGIIMPFIELGKDMRTFIMAALRENKLDIPRAWLEDIRRKSLYYAGNQSKFIAEYEKNNGGDKIFSSREKDILSDLYNGFSQTEIAQKRNLSINTVKMNMKNIYEKLEVHKVSDVVRIAAEQKLV